MDLRHVSDGRNSLFSCERRNGGDAPIVGVVEIQSELVGASDASHLDSDGLTCRVVKGHDAVELCVVSERPLDFVSVILSEVYSDGLIVGRTQAGGMPLKVGFDKCPDHSCRQGLGGLGRDLPKSRTRRSVEHCRSRPGAPTERLEAETCVPGSDREIVGESCESRGDVSVQFKTGECVEGTIHGKFRQTRVVEFESTIIDCRKWPIESDCDAARLDSSQDKAGGVFCRRPSSANLTRLTASYELC